MINTKNTLIVGAGPAGIRVAEVLVENGLHPIVVDEAPASGGQIYRQQPPGFKRSSRDRYGFESDKADFLHSSFDRLIDDIDYRPNTGVWSLEKGVAFTSGPEGINRIPFANLFLCTGGVDRVLPIPGWTLPGTYTLGGAQIALKAQGCLIGEQVVFMGSGPLLYLVAYQYAKAGARVSGVFDTAKLSDALPVLPGLLSGGVTLAKGIWYQNWLRVRGVTLRRGIVPIKIEGDTAISGFLYRDRLGREKYQKCDSLAFSWGVKPECQLAELAGCKMVFDDMARQWLPETDEDCRSDIKGIYLAGDGASVMGADAAEFRGELAALTMLADSGQSSDNSRRLYLKKRLNRLAHFRVALERALPYPKGLMASLPNDTLVCRCEGVTAGDIRLGQDLRPQEINRVKAYTRVGMGRCQGRMCGIAAGEILADEKGVSLEEVGRLRGQAPIKPLNIGTAGSAAQDDPNRAASI